jgi:phospholipase C
VRKSAGAGARWRRRAAAVALAVSLLGTAACNGSQTDPAPTPIYGSSGSPSASPVANLDKVLVVMEENRSVQEANAHMPFLLSQARSYGTATNFYAIRHPSLPNYLALAGGSTFGITDDDDPDAHPVHGSSVFGELVAAGRTAKTYAEAMPGNCALRNSGTYAVRHNPWTYFDDRAERAACERFDVPTGSPTSGALSDDTTAGKLPTFSLVVPDTCNDGHDCSGGTTDAWLRSWLPTIEKGPDFSSGRLAIVVTWDEDDDHSGNQVPMVVIHPTLKGKTVTTQLDHYGLSASIARIGGVPAPRDAKKADDVLAAFGL